MNLMKCLIAVSAAVLLSGTAVFAGSSSITITPPTVSGTADDNDANSKLAAEFGTIQARLQKDYFSKLHDQTDLARGFANAGASTRDNASMMGFQNYDIFCVMLGTNYGFAYPALSAKETSDAFENIKDKGDVYAGMGTGGIAGQVGINASFLVENLYLSAKFGTFSVSQDFGSGSSKTTLDIDQYMIGVGANYKWISSWDFLFGLAKWRGVSLGTGLVYNSATAKVRYGVADQNINGVTAGSYTFSGSVTDINARLTIDSSSLVIPLEATTSVQFLWLFNLGLGAGVDLIIPSSTIKIGGGARTTLSQNAGITAQDGKVSIVGTNSENKLKFTDVIAPRLAADLGFNISVVKIDIPISWYPFTKAVAIGASAGVAW